MYSSGMRLPHSEGRCEPSEAGRGCPSGLLSASDACVACYTSYSPLATIQRPLLAQFGGYNLITMAQHVLRVAATDDVTLYCQNPLFSQLKELWRFKIEGKEYARRKETAAVAGLRAKSSKVWDWGESLIRVNDGASVYYCYECELNMKRQRLPVITSGLSGAGKHMTGFHGRDLTTGLLKGSLADASSLSELVHTKNYDVFKLLMLKWFVFCQLALFMLENTYFRALISYMHAGLGGLLPKATSTLRGWIIDEFETQRGLLAAELSKSVSKVHITFDIWTAPNQRGYISVWAYWISSTGRQRRLLAFRRIYRSHTGEAQAEILLQILNDYSLTQRLGYCVSDNASSNDSACEQVFKSIDPSITAVAIQGRRLRCFGHIVNLSAQSLLATTGAEARAAALELEGVGDDEEGGEAVRARWIHAGPLGKLQRLVKYVLASGQRREEFGRISGGYQVKQYDNLGVSGKVEEGGCFSLASIFKFRRTSTSRRNIVLLLTTPLLPLLAPSRQLNAMEQHVHRPYACAEHEGTPHQVQKGPRTSRQRKVEAKRRYSYTF